MTLTGYRKIQFYMTKLGKINKQVRKFIERDVISELTKVILQSLTRIASLFTSSTLKIRP